MTSLLIKALRGENKERAPVWLMRQAGRYLPEYRKLREKYSLKELFLTPELSFQVAKMPIDRFGFDAAIVFSDITILALGFGLSLDFTEGPVITPEVNPSTVGNLTFSVEKLEPVFQSIRMLKKDLKIPLLGFCGAPFTVASYLAGGMEKTTSWMRKDPQSFLKFLNILEGAASLFLKMQQEAGADAVQIFDSWANVLTNEEFRIYSLKMLEKLVKSVQIPSLFFMREVSPYLEEIPCAISLDWTVDIEEARKRTKKSLQGNLDPNLLFQPREIIQEETAKLLQKMRNDRAFILNLGHGVKPNTPVEAVQCFVEVGKNQLVP